MNTSRQNARSDEPLHRTEQSSRPSLGAFLRARRERLSPECAGVQARAAIVRRRTPGLRREEVAQLAGISYEWYTYLEQDRDITPSAEVIERIAVALRMNAAEREYLHLLAFPYERARAIEIALPSPLRRFIDDLDYRPAYVVNDVWDIVGWNRAAANLFPDLNATAQPNLVRLVFLNANWRALYKEWEPQARKMLALFRLTVSTHFDDPRCASLVEALCAGSEEFSQWWRQQDVAVSTSGNKQLVLPQVGELSLNYTSLRTQEDAALTVIVFQPHDDYAKKKLQALFEEASQ